MKKLSVLAILAFSIFLAVPIVSAAHFIVGIANDALDTTSADGKTAFLWNPTNGVNDNLTDIIGLSGNSGANNFYLIDCELLNTPCQVGDEIRVQVLNSGDDYLSSYVNTTVTGAGFDLMPNITLNSPPIVTNITVDDALATPTGEIDLTPATTTQVICQGVITEYDGNETLANITGEFFDNSASFYGDSDDNNLHYTNNSCFMDSSYGAGTEAYFMCGFQAEYYTNSGNWNCTVRAQDDLAISSSSSNNTNINTLLALSIPSPIDFGEIDAGNVGPESQINVTNVGNTRINLSLSGYGSTINDGNAMNCSLGAVQNISIEYKRYNLTQSNTGSLNLSEFQGIYTNLSSDPVIRKFNLNYRQNDITNEAINSTYWRVYVPPGVSGSCSGNVIFGAVESPEA